MEVTIKYLQQSNAETYRNLRLKSYLDDPLAFSESFEDESVRGSADFAAELRMTGEPPEWFVLGVFNPEAKLIGFVKFRRDIRSKARHKAMIHAMYIDKAFRGNGIGRKLMVDLLTKARMIAGLEQIHLWVLHSGTSAAGFYRQLGFKSQGTIVKNDLKIGNVYVDAEYMVMYLKD